LHAHHGRGGAQIDEIDIGVKRGCDALLKLEARDRSERMRSEQREVDVARRARVAPGARAEQISRDHVGHGLMDEGKRGVDVHARKVSAVPSARH
jgi:hypothetical protein